MYRLFCREIKFFHQICSVYGGSRHIKRPCQYGLRSDGYHQGAQLFPDWAVLLSPDVLRFQRRRCEFKDKPLGDHQKWSEPIAAKDGKFDKEVSLNGTVIGCTLGTDGKTLITNKKYNDLPAGTNTFSAAGVKYPRLFPSYSFTFTVSVQK